MRVVIDSNVYIDGDMDDHSYANKIVDEVLSGRIQAFANRGTLQENRLILNREMKNEEYRDKLERCFDLINHVETVHVNEVSEDREDNKILASAIASEAEYLITSDRHLLVLESYGCTTIATPPQFWNRYRQDVLGENDWQKFVSQFFTND